MVLVPPGGLFLPEIIRPFIYLISPPLFLLFDHGVLGLVNFDILDDLADSAKVDKISKTPGRHA